MLSPDNYVANPFSSQGYNRYSYANNNPLVYTDPDGNFPWLAFAIGAVFGAWTGGAIANNGQMNPLKWDNPRTFGYVLGGAIIGGLSGAAGGAIAASGMPFANTAGIVTSSFFNSVGMAMLTNGQMPASIGFGFGSYSLQSGGVDYLGEKGNSFLTNLGFGFGAMANLQDVVAGVNGINATYKAESGRVVHARLEGEYIDKESVTHQVDISVAHPPAPAGAYKYDGSSGFLNNLDYARYWFTHVTQGTYHSGHSASFAALRINNINGK
jgi:hypothetical protein